MVGLAADSYVLLFLLALLLTSASPSPSFSFLFLPCVVSHVHMRARATSTFHAIFPLFCCCVHITIVRIIFPFSSLSLSLPHNFWKIFQEIFAQWTISWQCWGSKETIYVMMRWCVQILRNPWHEKLSTVLCWTLTTDTGPVPLEFIALYWG